MATNVSGTQITLGDSSTVTSAATTVGATTARSGETYTGRRGGGIYEFDTNVPSTTDGSVEPSSGQLYFNNGTAANVTRAVIHKTSFDGGDLNSYMDMWVEGGGFSGSADGFLIIKSNVNDDTSGIVLKMTNQNDYTNHRSITCTFVAGTIPNTDEEVVQINFVPFGRRGSSPPGPAGTPGGSGPPGPPPPPDTSECLVYGMQVLLHNHKLINVEDLKIGDYILTNKGEVNDTSVYTKVENILTEHLREGYYIINNELMITNDHPVVSNDGWKKVEDLVVGDSIGVNKITSIRYVPEDVMTVSVLTSSDEFMAIAQGKYYRVSGKYSKFLKKVA